MFFIIYRRVFPLAYVTHFIPILCKSQLFFGVKLKKYSKIFTKI